jgi:hypothetical protein
MNESIKIQSIFIYILFYLYGFLYISFQGDNNKFQYEANIAFFFLYYIGLTFITIISLSLISKSNLYKDKNYQFNLINILNLLILLYITYTIFTFYISWDYFFSRNVRENIFFNGNTYALIIILIKVFIAYQLSLIGEKCFKQNYLFLLMPIILVLHEAIYLGGRRLSIYLIILLSIYYVRSCREFLKIGIIMVAIFILFILLGGYREMNLGNEFNLLAILNQAISSNEFEYVSGYWSKYFLYHETATFEETLKSYFSPIVFIKPIAELFSIRTLPQMLGLYPYIYGELYYNFGLIGGLLLGVYLGLFPIALDRYSKYAPMICAFSLEIFRTSLAEYIVTLLLMVLIFKLLDCIYLFKPIRKILP